MSISCKAFILLGLLASSLTGYAQAVNVNSVHYWTAPKRARMMIDVSSRPDHSVKLLDQPPRLVIDIHDAKLARALNQPPSSHALFSKVRTVQKDNDVRIVVNLKKPASQNSFTLKPNKMYGHRLVVDLTDLSATDPIISQASEARDSVKAKSSSIKSARLKKTASHDLADSSNNILPVSRRGKNIIVAIDAGHGGDDPGAHGSNGTEEKKVVYSIARKLESLINAQRGMRAVMVRKGDYYVDLRKRMDIARASKADLFISIHADAFQSTHVKGASVFTLSSRGASSEAARWLADSENASDLVGGVSLDDKEEVLASVLLDLSQMATQEASHKVAKQVLKNFQDVGELHLDTVQKAGFLVLKSPDIPSILVETGFISNPSEERKLKNSAHQSKIALAIFKGVRDYFKQYAPVDTRVAGL
ncbi:MAG: N-acetylmuramoyl-L-alanine amidase [Methylosarcina sp.]